MNAQTCHRCGGPIGRRTITHTIAGKPVRRWVRVDVPLRAWCPADHGAYCSPYQHGGQWADGRAR